MGPEKWGAMRQEWSMCSHGTMQSPIDMSSRRVEMVETYKKLYTNYKPCNATILNRGHDIMLKWEGDAGLIIINGTEYALKQAHWHSPSEHTINGRRIGKPGNFLSKLAVNISSMIDQKGMREHSGIIDPREIQMSSRIDTYVCNTHGKSFIFIHTNDFMFIQMRTVSIGQVKLLREAVNDDGFIGYL
ncbi:hypothetical protein L1987_86778 [Smallanthus sonchifolius]|uniref:Uncharacterized protein n=1 Tax=Smallanthus sonchifolius TaxID=185202 RepID=A0ACB8Y095_9ASTR|nr:hypothetical protein L1987_86778 [Smallanthus sonchifolius]